MEALSSLIIVLLALLGLALIGARLFMLIRKRTDVVTHTWEPPTNTFPAPSPPETRRLAEQTPHPAPHSTSGPYPAPNRIEDKRWLKLIEECIALYDELDRNSARFEPRDQELADHVCYRLQEILERSGVEAIAGDTTFDYTRHQPEGTTASIAVGTVIAETLSSGFLLDRQVLRRARVRLIESPPTRAT